MMFLTMRQVNVGKILVPAQTYNAYIVNIAQTKKQALECNGISKNPTALTSKTTKSASKKLAKS